MSWPGKNALGTASMSELRESIRRADGAPILLTGTGDAFSAGLDLREVAGFAPPAMREFLALLESLMCTLFQYPAPTVALVNGHAIAGGCILALACDHRVALPEPKGRIGLNEVALGVQFPPRVLEIVRRRLPPPRLDELLLGAGLVPLPRAAEYGLVDELAADAAAGAVRARARLEELARHPAATYAATKRALRGAVPADLVSDAVAQAHLDAALPSWTSPELKARLASVLDRGKKA